MAHWFDENMFATHRYERFLKRSKTYISYLWSSISLTYGTSAGGSPLCLFMSLNILWMLLESPVDLSHNKVKNGLFRHIKTSATISLLSWWIALHTMTEGPWSPSIGWMHAFISPSPVPPQWNVKRDSSLKTQCLHCLRSHLLCIFPHTWLYRPWPKVNLGHLAGRLV